MMFMDIIPVAICSYTKSEKISESSLKCQQIKHWCYKLFLSNYIGIFNPVTLNLGF